MRVCREEVEDFLEMVRDAIDNKRFTFISREKNRKSMAQHGLLVRDVLDEIYNLTYGNYVCGPEPDDDVNEPDPVWIFKTYIICNTFYIKIKIVVDDNQKLKIISFHIAEY